ncbi:MAG: hypothetical protein JO331_09615 [Verrucomicrobia bacterium]|nr:hypothetical protein [Verrucomicrobiota bacterium]
MRYVVMLEGGPEHWAIWEYVPTMVRDGRVSLERVIEGIVGTKACRADLSDVATRLSSPKSLAKAEALATAGSSR